MDVNIASMKTDAIGAGADANIDTLRVDNVDEVNEASLADLTNPGVLTQTGADVAITNNNDAIE